MRSGPFPWPALPVPALALSLLLVVPLLVLGGPVPRAAAADPVADPLGVRIDEVAPAAIPQRGPVVVTGVVTNPGSQSWTDVRAYPLTSQHPMTDSASLAAAVQSPADTDLGSRLLSVGEKLGNLAPGASVRFRLRVPRSKLMIDGTPGVYWLGVQVLGANRDGRDQLADGRARTFLPLVARRTEPVPVSLVVPVREHLSRSGDGSLRDAGALAATLAADGRLGRVLSWAQQAPTGALTWLLDPAVVQGAADVAAGDPDLGVHRAGTSPSATPSPTTSASPTGPGSGTASPDQVSTGAGAPPVPELTDQGQRDARTWLAGLTTSAQHQHVLALPYADPDVSAIAGADPSLLAAGSSLAHATLTEQHVSATDAVAPPDGYLDPHALPALARPATVLLTDHGPTATDTSGGTGAPGGAGLVAGTARVVDGHTVVVTASGATDPPTGSPDSALQLRQRLLADAALRALDGTHLPLLVQLPQHFDPGDSTGATFFAGLDALPWVALGPLPSGTDTTGSSTTGTAAPRLPWPRRARAHRVPRLNVATAATVHRASTVLSQLLDDEAARVDRVVTGAALATVSYHARRAPRAARSQVQPLLARVHQLLGLIAVLGTDFVTLSGDAGYLTVAVVNGLDQPITVGVRTLEGAPGVRIDLPDPTRLAAGQRSTLRLQAHSTAPGVHVVRLVPVTSEGLRVGAPLVFNLRTSQVGQYFWGVLGLLALALVALVVRRIRQRLRERGRTS